MTTYTMSLLPALPMNTEMYPWGPLISPSMMAIMCKVQAMGTEVIVTAVDAVDMVDAVNKPVKAEFAMEMGNRVSVPMAKLTAIPQMYAKNRNAYTKEEKVEKTAEELFSIFDSRVGSQARPRFIVSPTNM